jgi:ERCC4-type nuclease
MRTMWLRAAVLAMVSLGLSGCGREESQTPTGDQTQTGNTAEQTTAAASGMYEQFSGQFSGYESQLSALQEKVTDQTDEQIVKLLDTAEEKLDTFKAKLSELRNAEGSKAEAIAEELKQLGEQFMETYKEAAAELMKGGNPLEGVKLPGS